MESNAKVNCNRFVFLLIFSGIFTLINSSIVHINGEYLFQKISSFNCLPKKFVILCEIMAFSVISSSVIDGKHRIFIHANCSRILCDLAKNY